MESFWPKTRPGELWGALDDAELERLLAVMDPCTAAAGDLVFQKGSPARSLLVVEEGQLEVFDEVMGDVVVLGEVNRGGVAGEVGFLDGCPRTHHVRARTDCRLRRLTREGLLSLVEKDAALFAKLTIALAQLVAQRFRAAVEELEPVRAFAASLREPLEMAESSFDELEEPLPEELAAELPAAATPDEAVKVLKRAARKGRKSGASGAGV